MSSRKADFYTGARKILRNRHFSFDSIGPELQLFHAGYTESKRRALIKLYQHEESLETAVKLWDRRLGQKKYGSVSFHCYNHLIKNDPDKKSKRASVMGPCIQAVSITYLESKETAIDCFYRTTELFKKFPADLVFIRDNLLPRFNFETAPVREINFHFANITCHPMYFVILTPWMDDPVAEFERIRKIDNYFWQWAVKWTARFVCDEHKRGIQKFAQAMRVHDEARKNLKAQGKLEIVADYCRKNHPGYRHDYVDPDIEEDEAA